MRKTARECANVCVFLSAAMLLLAPISTASAQTTGKVTQARHSDVPSDLVVKEIHISMLKFALNLRPAQEPYWVPVEHALREMARWQAAASEFDSLGRSSSVVASRIKRIAAMAAPLIKALDDNQRRSLQTLSRWAGLEQLLASN